MVQVGARRWPPSLFIWRGRVGTAQIPLTRVRLARHAVGEHNAAAHAIEVRARADMDTLRAAHRAEDDEASSGAIGALKGLGPKLELAIAGAAFTGIADRAILDVDPRLELADGVQFVGPRDEGKDLLNRLSAANVGVGRGPVVKLGEGTMKHEFEVPFGDVADSFLAEATAKQTRARKKVCHRRRESPRERVHARVGGVGGSLGAPRLHTAGTRGHAGPCA